MASSTAIKQRKPRSLFRVSKGALIPHDAATVAQLRAKRYQMGDVVSVQISKSRNPKFHGLAHRLGGLIAENIEAFEGMEPHAVLKRLQIEGNVGCDEIALIFPGVGPCSYRQARSLSFDSMDEGEFKGVIAAMCKYVSKQYWSMLTPEQIEAMADSWVEDR